MPRILILFAHPALEQSRIHRRLLHEVPAFPRITLHDLYEEYPDYDVDVGREQRLLADHDLIVFQHPFYWYSIPPLLKQWLDLVLQHGWAYGSGGHALRGKRFLNIITSGGGEGAYHAGGHNRFTVRQLLVPLEQTARLCGMEYLPPYVVFGAHRLTDPDVETVALRYRALLSALQEDRIEFAGIEGFPTLNDALGSATEALT